MTVRKWGAETLVNTNATNSQNQPVVSALADGGFVITWTDSNPAGGDGSVSSIKMQRYDAFGNKVGGETLVNTTTLDQQIICDIAILSDGSFVVAWIDTSGANGTLQDVRFRRFDADGTPIDAADRIAVGAGDQSDAQVVALTGGGFAVIYKELGASSDIKLIRFDAAGTALDVPPINVAATANNESAPDIAVLADGSMIAAFHNATSDHIFVQRIAANGSLIGGPLQVSNATGGAAGDHNFPRVTTLANGGFVVTWQDNSDALPDADGTAIHAQLFDAALTQVGAELVVNTATAGTQQAPEIIAIPGGGFAIVWATNGGAGGIRGQLFDEFGARLGVEFIVSTVTDGANPAIAALADGRLVVTWDDNNPAGGDGSGASIRMQIIDPRDGVVTGTNAGETLLGHDLLNDEINGLGGADTLNGLGGADNLYGSEGGDTYVVGAGDQVFEVVNAGTDLVQASVSFALGANVENLTLTGAAAIDGTGNALANTIIGNAAANVLTGGLGTDSVSGGLGNDTYVLENSADVVTDTGGTDTITSTITRSLTSFAAIENLTLLGAAVANATGNGLANILTGNGAANILTGGLLTDTLIGGLGSDTYVLENGADIVIDSGGTADLATSTISRSLAAGGLTAIEKLTLLGTAAINGTGNGLANIITGNNANNVLNGGIGNDTLRGLLGNDTLIGNAGKDTSTGGAGNDVFRFLNKAHSFGALTDVVTDFDDFGNDRIDVSALFGPALIFRGGLAFTAAGQLRINDVAGADVIVEVNTGGSLAADFQLRLAGTTLASMTAGDFFL